MFHPLLLREFLRVRPPPKPVPRLGMPHFGLFFLAFGSAMIMPCLTTLVTLYTPSQEQGRSVGIFRSMGALARVVGPIVAAIAYYKYGAWAPYVFGSAFLLMPILLLVQLPTRPIEA